MKQLNKYKTFLIRKFSKYNLSSNILLEKYQLLIDNNKIEKNESQIQLIHKFDKLNTLLTLKKPIFDKLNSQKESFWNEEIPPEKTEDSKGIFSFFRKNKRVENKNEFKSVVINGKKTVVRSLFAYKKYEEMLISYNSDLSEIKGLYIYGSPGCGKTYLMDMFFEEVKVKKRRAHFHEFMIDIHQRLHVLKDTITYKQSDMDPLYILATELSKEFNLLCFDEFQVTDIADAVILKRLFEVLYQNYVFMVATSNRHPDRLYLQGLQRHVFLPFIDEVKHKCDVVYITAKDFRVRHDIVHNQYLYPKDDKDENSQSHYHHSKLKKVKLTEVEKDNASKFGINPEGFGYIYGKSKGKDYIVNEEIHKEFIKIFRLLTDNKHPKEMTFDVAMNRTITCHKWANGVGYFHFHELCEMPVGTSDYIAIAQNCSTVMLEGIPKFNIAYNRNSLRAFINLIDELYNHNVMLYCTAEAGIEDLFVVEKDEEDVYDESFAFDRTKSRLNEMQSELYKNTKQHKFYVKDDENKID